MYMLILILSDSDNDIIYAIYTKHKKRLLYVAKSYLGDRAEDAVHDVFIILAEKFEKRIEELCDKQDYFFVTILKNRAIDILRKERNVEFEGIDSEESIFDDQRKRPEQIIVGQEDIARLVAYLDQLKPKYREVLEYKYLLGFSNNEIAEIMGISPSVVSTRAQRALNQLKERFEQEEW